MSKPSNLQRKIAAVYMQPVEHSYGLRLAVELTDGDILWPHCDVMWALAGVLGTDITAWAGQEFDLAITPHTDGWHPRDDMPVDADEMAF